MRNNLLNKDIEIDFDACNLDEKERKIASWEHVIKAYEIDVYADFLDRHVPKWTEQHVYPEKINKMKVKLMMLVFSKKVIYERIYTTNISLHLFFVLHAQQLTFYLNKRSYLLIKSI